MSTPSRGWQAPVTSLVRAPRTGNATFIILSPRLHCFATHWDGQREQLCWREIGQTCPLCTPANGHRRSYYAVVRGGESRPEPVILHLPFAAVQFCPALVERMDNCRGLVVRVERFGRGGKVRVVVDERRPDPERLTDSGEWLVCALMRLWGVPPELVGHLDLTYLGTGTTPPAVATSAAFPAACIDVSRLGSRPGGRVGSDGCGAIGDEWRAMLARRPEAG